MWKANLILVLIIILSACCGEEQSDIVNQDFTLEVEFYPSFIPSSKLVIEKKDEKKTLTIYKLLSAADYKLKDFTDGLSEAEYQFMIDSTYRQFYVGDFYKNQVEHVSLADETFQIFTKNVKEVNLLKQENIVKTGWVDGITLYIKYSTDCTENNFRYRMPLKNDSQFVLVESLITLMGKSFTDQSTVTYLRELEGYFDSD